MSSFAGLAFDYLWFRLQNNSIAVGKHSMVLQLLYTTTYTLRPNRKKVQFPFDITLFSLRARARMLAHCSPRAKATNTTNKSNFGTKPTFTIYGTVLTNAFWGEDAK